MERRRCKRCRFSILIFSQYYSRRLPIVSKDFLFDRYLTLDSIISIIEVASISRTGISSQICNFQFLTLIFVVSLSSPPPPSSISTLRDHRVHKRLCSHPPIDFSSRSTFTTFETWSRKRSTIHGLKRERVWRARTPSWKRSGTRS